MDKNSLEEVVIGVQTGVSTLVGCCCILASFVGLLVGGILILLATMARDAALFYFAGIFIVFVSFGLNRLGIMFARSWLNSLPHQ